MGWIATPRIFIFSIVLGAECLSYLKSIETHARAFLTLIILSIGTVKHRQFHKFSYVIFGGFLSFETSVQRRRPWSRCCRTRCWRRPATAWPWQWPFSQRPYSRFDTKAQIEFVTNSITYLICTLRSLL